MWGYPLVHTVGDWAMDKIHVLLKRNRLPPCSTVIYYSDILQKSIFLLAEPASDTWIYVLDALVAQECIVKSRQLKVILARLPILWVRISPSRLELMPLGCDRADTLPLNQATTHSTQFTVLTYLLDEVASIIRVACTKELPLMSYHLSPVLAVSGQLSNLIKYNIWIACKC